MVKYTIKRLLQSVVTVLIVVTIVFLLMRMLPIESLLTQDQLIKYTEEQKHDALEKAGMLDSMPNSWSAIMGSCFMAILESHEEFRADSLSQR